jgi:phage terminase small subunit
MPKTAFLPPSHLSAPSKRWFRQVCEDYALEPHHYKLLTLCCTAWDRAEEARVAIERHGLVYIDRFGCPRSRPEVAVERDARVAYARLLRELDLDAEPAPAPSRPPLLARVRKG